MRSPNLEQMIADIVNKPVWCKHCHLKKPVHTEVVIIRENGEVMIAHECPNIHELTSITYYEEA